MNIFVTSDSPIESARYLDDKRVIKMCTESAQMLSTAIRLKTDYPLKDELYKVTHINHPCNKWTMESQQNYQWLLLHFIELCNEYTRRYGKVHASMSLLKHFEYNKYSLPDIGLTSYANCAARQDLGISFKHLKDTKLAYKLYLKERWKLDKRIPTWYKEEHNEILY